MKLNTKNKKAFWKKDPTDAEKRFMLLAVETYKKMGDDEPHFQDLLACAFRLTCDFIDYLEDVYEKEENKNKKKS